MVTQIDLYIRLSPQLGAGKEIGDELSACPLVWSEDAVCEHWLLCPQVFDMHIGAQALVVGQIPAWMVGILVDYDVVRVP